MEISDFVSVFLTSIGVASIAIFAFSIRTGILWCVFVLSSIMPEISSLSSTLPSPRLSMEISLIFTIFLPFSFLTIDFTARTARSESLSFENSIPFPVSAVWAIFRRCSSVASIAISDKTSLALFDAILYPLMIVVG